MRNCFLHCVILTGIITDAWSIQKLHTGIVRAIGRAFTLYTTIISLVFRGFFSWLSPSEKIRDNGLFLQKRGHFFSIAIIQLATISNYRASFPQFIIRIDTAPKFIQKKDVLIYFVFVVQYLFVRLFFFSVIWRHQEYLLFCYLPIINIKGIHYFSIEMALFIKIQ